MNNLVTSEKPLDFSFGFNDANYSHTTLLLEITHSHDVSLHRSVCNVTPRPPTGFFSVKLIHLETKTIYINSLVLAARSPFFRKFFSNGMQVSVQKDATLRIEAIEETPLMDLLKYVYSNILPTGLDALLDLLVVADKFEVASCFRDCCGPLQNFPMNCELTSTYLNFPSTMFTYPSIQPLTDAAKQFHCTHLTEFKGDVLALTLHGVQEVQSRDDLQVTSEFGVYDIVLTWARKHYPDSKERREILKTHLLQLVRFPFMTTTQLTEHVITCSDIDPELASKIVMRALCFKPETPHEKHRIALQEAASRQFVERAYKYRPVKLFELDSRNKHYVVYLSLTKEELIDIFPDGQIMSETFHLGEHEHMLSGICNLFKPIGHHNFWLALKNVGSSSTSYMISYDILIKGKMLNYEYLSLPSDEFKRWESGCHEFTKEGSIKYIRNEPWIYLMGDDPAFFVDDVLHLRVEFKIEK